MRLKNIYVIRKLNTTVNLQNIHNSGGNENQS